MASVSEQVRREASAAILLWGTRLFDADAPVTGACVQDSELRVPLLPPEAHEEQEEIISAHTSAPGSGGQPEQQQTHDIETGTQGSAQAGHTLDAELSVGSRGERAPQLVRALTPRAAARCVRAAVFAAPRKPAAPEDCARALRPIQRRIHCAGTRPQCMVARRRAVASAARETDVRTPHTTGAPSRPPPPSPPSRSRRRAPRPSHCTWLISCGC